jgi:NADPH2 dehydrogenase
MFYCERWRGIMSNLFDSMIIKSHKIKNRVAVPPMVCFGYAEENGYVTKMNITHYEALAKGGAGLIVLEAHAVEKDGRLANTQLGIWKDEHTEGLKRVAEVCHRYDSVALVQIHHAGLKTPKNVSNLAIAPSPYEKDGTVAREITMDEVKRVQESFLKAAKRAKKAGFHGVELHGAHGYLIDQFMSPIINKRTDKYGGTIENRMRFAIEIVEMIKEELGKDFIIGYRMGGNEPTLEEGIVIAKTLEEKGVDLLHVSAGIQGDTIPEPPKDFPYNWIVYMGTEIKKAVKIPVIVVNGVKVPSEAAYLVENNLADFVAVGRAHLVDPNWAKKAEANKEPAPCLKCPKCLWFKDGRNCPGRKAI